jgi:hypothetical protein
VSISDFNSIHKELVIYDKYKEFGEMIDVYREEGDGGVILRLELS